MRILLTGANGYVGGRLAPLLLAAGHEVRATFTDLGSVPDTPWAARVEAVEMDALDAYEVAAAVEGVDAVVYLIHGMGGDDFMAADRSAATHMAQACARSSVQRIVYLSGLVPQVDESELSDHISSRLEVEEILTRSGVPTVSLRAAVLIGSASTSFELIRQISERLPLHVVPTWMDSNVQPIAVVDALAALVAAVESDVASRHYDIGGTEVLSYAELLRRYGTLAGKERPQVSVPLLPQAVVKRVAAALVDLPSSTVQSLMESLRHDMVCLEDDFRAELLEPGHELLDLDTAITRALADDNDLDDPDPMGPLPTDPDWAQESVA